MCFTYPCCVLHPGHAHSWSIERQIHDWTTYIYDHSWAWFTLHSLTLSELVSYFVLFFFLPLQSGGLPNWRKTWQIETWPQNYISIHSHCEWVVEWASMSAWVSGWVSEWVHEWVVEWASMSAWVSGWVSEYEYMSEWLSERVWVHEWVVKWVSMSAWVSGWVSVLN